jgi:hypothetical protein
VGETRDMRRPEWARGCGGRNSGHRWTKLGTGGACHARWAKRGTSRAGICAGVRWAKRGASMGEI